VSSEGAPRYIEGMKSRKVWVIAVAIMKIRIRLVGIRLLAVRTRRVVVIRLMWMPGIRPVIVPVRVPRRRGIIKWSICLGRAWSC